MKRQPHGNLTTVGELVTHNGYRFSMTRDEDGDVMLAVTAPDGRWSLVADNYNGGFTAAERAIIGSFIEELA